VRISFSRIAKYARCPEQFRRSYIGEEKDSAPWAIPGKALHEAAEALELKGWDSIDFAQRFMRAFIEAEVSPGRMQQRALSYVTPYLERRVHENEELAFQFYGRSADSGTEVELKYQFGDHEFIGYIDQVFYDSKGRLVSRDLKTGVPVPKDRVQVQIYNLVWNLTHTEPISYSQLLYLGKDKPEPQVVMLRIDKQAFHNLLTQFIRAMEANYFPPIGALTDACRTCFVRNDCQYAGLQEESQVYVGGK
jgi:hypothetical protein